MKEQEIKDALKKLEPIIGKKTVKALWYRHLMAKDWEKKEKSGQKILIMAETILSLLQEPILLPPTEIKAGDIKIGKVTYNGKTVQEFSIQKQDLIKHVAVFGKTGCGKTNTAYQIIKGILKQDIPFFIFDWKRSFRDLLKLPEFKGKIEVYTVGREIRPFNWNTKNKPKATDEEVYTKKHLEVIEWAYFLGQGAHDILIEAYDKGNFSEMKEWLEKQHRKLRGREMLWSSSAKRTLNALNYGAVGRMLNHKNPMNLKNLLKKNVLFEFDGLTEADKCYFIGMILLWTYEFRKTQPERDTLKHVLLIDEAHHIFRKKPDTKPEDITDIMFRELREFGESIIIFDQHPHRTSSQALGNTNIKIGMQMDLEKDRYALAGCLLLNRDQREFLGRLKVGEGIAKTGETEKPFLVKMEKVELVKGSVTDYQLKHIFKNKYIPAPPNPGVYR
jgi:energy-coupling factor transporter ATP-binding protein EcfA2